eukprot:TRINITY_DN1649_c0_g1_i1.p5 TRINITY_DN1649_c0_g1~~TRINITY_DN1649_c0_g1_i1.p5  ORF type:complete len:52 (+),score=10.49 TRINITY_DN1649_c0_g1_i1:305-460(+)
MEVAGAIAAEEAVDQAEDGVAVEEAAANKCTCATKRLVTNKQVMHFILSNF